MNKIRIIAALTVTVSSLAFMQISALAQKETDNRITRAEAKHIVAYYFKAQNKLVVYNQRSLALGIERGVYHLVWKPGAEVATLTISEPRSGGGRANLLPTRVTAGVQYLAGSGVLEGTQPKLGDTRMVEFAKKIDIAEQIEPCTADPTKFFKGVPPNTKGTKYVLRGHTYLSKDGDESGQETFTITSRYYNYGLKDCSRGRLADLDVFGAFVLSVQAWPN
jgi:hypothetical protein